MTLADLGLRLREIEPGRAWSLESDDGAPRRRRWSSRARGGAGDAGLARERVAHLPRERAARPDAARCPTRSSPRVDAGAWQQLGAPPPAAPRRRRLRERAAHRAQRLGGRASSARARATSSRSQYYLWHEEGRLETRQAPFRVAGIVPIRGAAADRDLVPEYPGITRADAPRRLGPAVPGRPVAHPARRTRTTGSATARHRRRSCRSRRARSCGGTGWGARRRCGSSRRGRRLDAAHGSRAGASLAALAARLDAGVAGPGRGRRARRARSRPRAARPTSASTSSTSASSWWWPALLLAGLFFRLGLEQRLARGRPAAGRRLHRGAPAAAVPRRRRSRAGRPRSARWAWPAPSPTRG